MTEKWYFDHGWGTTHPDIRNIYRRENVIFEPGRVTIKTHHHPEGVEGWTSHPDGIQYHARDYSSGLMISKRSFLYGTFEASLILPDFRGAWPAFWLYPQAEDGLHETDYDEIDWLEQFRKDNCISKSRVHIGIYKKSWQIPDKTHISRKILYFYRRINVTGEWSPDKVEIFINGKSRMKITDSRKISHRPMNLFVNNAVGNWRPKLNPDEKKNDLIITKLTYNQNSLI